MHEYAQRPALFCQMKSSLLKKQQQYGQVCETMLQLLLESTYMVTDSLSMYDNDCQH